MRPAAPAWARRPRGIFAPTGSGSRRRPVRSSCIARCSWKSARSAVCRGRSCLAAAAAGPAIREAQRELLTGTVQPLSDLVAEEASRVLESTVTITHHKLAAADVAARARGVHILTQAGIDSGRALELVGWAS